MKLGDEAGGDLGFIGAGQVVVMAAVAVGQLVVFQTHQVKDGSDLWWDGILSVARKTLIMLSGSFMGSFSFNLVFGSLDLFEWHS